MAYQPPEEVKSPKARWKLERIICNAGPDKWSVAEGLWDDEHSLAMRWNGLDWPESFGNPQSRGMPTWFIVPNEFEDVVRNKAVEIGRTIDRIFPPVIKRPHGYDEGAFLISIALTPNTRDQLCGIDLVFKIPKIEHWLIIPFQSPDEGRYEAISPDGSLLGKFMNGSWRGHLYTQRYSLPNNPTKIDVIRQHLSNSVLEALGEFLGEAE